VLDSRDPSFIDGFNSVQAVRRSGRSTAEARTRTSRLTLPITEHPEEKPRAQPGAVKPASRIGHTAIPERHEIVCYACGFAFFLTGRFEKTYCPKCRECLPFKEVTIDRRWSGAVKTVGVVTIAPGGVVDGGTIVATDVVLGGPVEHGRVVASRRLELAAGAPADLSNVAWRDLRVQPGAVVTLSGEIVCRDIVVEGELTATLAVSGTITVEPGGFLKGAVRGAHLVVKDGGGLHARLHIAPDAAAPAPAPPIAHRPEAVPEKTERPARRKRAAAPAEAGAGENAACKSPRASRNSKVKPDTDA
jgi:cytoskeletal protein CcmA (bactofilin family)